MIVLLIHQRCRYGEREALGLTSPLCRQFVELVDRGLGTNVLLLIISTVGSSTNRQGIPALRQQGPPEFMADLSSNLKIFVLTAF